MRLYRKPSHFELEKALMQLSEPMDCNLSIEVMLKSIEEVQMFLLDWWVKDIFPHVRG